MFDSINAAYLDRRKAIKDNSFILESVLEVEETLPGSEEELEDITDPDSVPEDVYKALDKELDRIVSDPNYDDTEAAELMDDDVDEDEIDDSVLDAIVDEAAEVWELSEMAKVPNEYKLGAAGGALVGAITGAKRDIKKARHKKAMESEEVQNAMKKRDEADKEVEKNIARSTSTRHIPGEFKTAMRYNANTGHNMYNTHYDQY